MTGTPEQAKVGDPGGSPPTLHRKVTVVRSQISSFMPNPVELTVELTPRARFDVIDVRGRAAVLHGNVLDAYRRCLYYSFHTTAGYLEQSLATRLTRSRSSVEPSRAS